MSSLTVSAFINQVDPEDIELTIQRFETYIKRIDNIRRKHAPVSRDNLTAEAVSNLENSRTLENYEAFHEIVHDNANALRGFLSNGEALLQSLGLITLKKAVLLPSVNDKMFDAAYSLPAPYEVARAMNDFKRNWQIPAILRKSDFFTVARRYIKHAVGTLSDAIEELRELKAANLSRREAVDRRLKNKLVALHDRLGYYCNWLEAESRDEWFDHAEYFEDIYEDVVRLVDSIESNFAGHRLASDIADWRKKHYKDFLYVGNTGRYCLLEGSGDGCPPIFLKPLEILDKAEEEFGEQALWDLPPKYNGLYKKAKEKAAQSLMKVLKKIMDDLDAIVQKL